MKDGGNDEATTREGGARDPARVDESGAELLIGDDRGVDAEGARFLPIERAARGPTWTCDRVERRVRWAVLIAACMLFLPNLGAFGLWDPWETHYGAVTTEMLETYDWVSPWWGWRGKLGGEAANEAGGFYSKPIFIFWSEALISRVIGRGEWSIRLPCAILAIMAVFLTYLAASRVWSRRTGLLAAGVLATSPFFFMVSRQAQTDMPFVATLVIAMCFFVLAVFARGEVMTLARFKRRTMVVVGVLAALALPQYGLLLTDFPAPHAAAVQGFPSSFLHKGWLWALAYTLLFAGVLAHARYAWAREKKAVIAQFGEVTPTLIDRWNRKYFLWIFYATLAFSSYAKGLLGFLLPGAILFFWLLASNNWRLLVRVELLRGVAIFFALGLPWYVAMLVKHGNAYFQRFFIHDHFNRAFSGVHQIDSGTFEHFIKWLGIGFFPWVVFLPLALFWLLRLRPRDRRPENQALVFFAVWALFAFSLFTYSSTKFHHYIFPAVPPMAVVLALFIRWLVKEGGWALRFAVILAFGVAVAVGTDIQSDPQHLRNLMTYKYDRPMPPSLPTDATAKVADGASITWEESYFFKHTSGLLRATLTAPVLRFDRFIPAILIGVLIALGLFFAARTRMAGLVGLGLMASALGVWSLNHYLPSLTPHWSQKYLFDAYYDTCTMRPMSEDIRDAYEPWLAKVGLGGVADYLRSEPKRICEEDITAWLITWRGETYYSYNELVPLNKKEQLPTYLEQMNHGRKFYVIAEKGRAQTIRSELKAATETLKKKDLEAFADIEDWEVKAETEENHFFQTLSATPVRGRSAPTEG